MHAVTPSRRDLIHTLLQGVTILTAVSLFGYATINLVRMPSIGPDAFVPKDLAHTGRSVFGLLQLIFILGFSFGLLPLTVVATVRRYADHPAGMILGCTLMCAALLVEIFNNLPFLGAFVYPDPLGSVPRDVLLYLNQTAAIRYLSFDVAGFSLLYASLLVYGYVFRKTAPLFGWLVVASIVLFSASAPFLWIHGATAVTLLAVSVYCTVPIPLYFGRMALRGDAT